MKENTFEAIKRIDDNGSEYWSSRDLAKVLEYTDYRNFLTAVDKAKVACENSGEVIHNHFVHTDEMVAIGSGAERPVDAIFQNYGYKGLYGGLTMQDIHAKKRLKKSAKVKKLGSGKKEDEK